MKFGGPPKVEGGGHLKVCYSYNVGSSSLQVPIIMIGFIGIGGTQIPAQVSAWVAVFVLPLNSAVNPILYTMSALDCSG